jgi:hypothetical protein
MRPPATARRACLTANPKARTVGQARITLQQIWQAMTTGAPPGAMISGPVAACLGQAPGYTAVADGAITEPFSGRDTSRNQVGLHAHGFGDLKLFEQITIWLSSRCATASSANRAC